MAVERDLGPDRLGAGCGTGARRRGRYGRFEIADRAEDLLPVAPNLIAPDEAARRMGRGDASNVRGEQIDEPVEISPVRRGDQRLEDVDPGSTVHAILLWVGPNGPRPITILQI